MASTSSGRRRVPTKLYAAEDQAFNQIANEAEARLAARRQARAEAREIRMKELEKQQKEADEQSDRHYELLTDVTRNSRQSRDTGRSSSYISGTSSYASSRRSSEDSMDALDLREIKSGLVDSRELKFQLSDLEDKFRRAMINNAQLDNEKSAYSFQVETLKDEIEELLENYNEVQKDYREKKRLYDMLQRDFKDMKQENEALKQNLKQRDQLIEDHGLVLVGDGTMVNGNIDDDNTYHMSYRKERKTSNNKIPYSNVALISQRSAQILDRAGNGSLDVRLKKFVEEKQELLDEIYRLRLNLEEERQKLSKMEHMSSVHGPQTNGPDSKVVEVQREANKQVNDYKYKLKKAEQEITTLQSNISRLESQVMRYKTATENAEKVEDELKAERRKLQRELREAQSRIEELETANAHLQKRIDKLKSGRNAILKS